MHKEQSRRSLAVSAHFTLRGLYKFSIKKPRLYIARISKYNGPKKIGSYSVIISQLRRCLTSRFLITRKFQWFAYI